jgi:hypothetical protein
MTNCLLNACLLNAEYVRVTRELLPRLSDLKFRWICFHGEGDHVSSVRWVLLLQDVGHFEYKVRSKGVSCCAVLHV